MSTFDTNGIVTGYKVNRPLNNHEQKHRFTIRNTKHAGNVLSPSATWRGPMRCSLNI